MPEETASESMLTTHVKWFEDYDEATSSARGEAQRDRDYFDNKQWTPEELNTLKRRKQAAIVYNRIKAKVNFLLGHERQTRTDPKAFPRTPQHEDSAEAATDSIRFVCDNNDFDASASDGYENLAIEGVTGFEVNVNADSAEIEISRVLYDRVWFDPHSRERNFSDARYIGTAQWMDFDDLKDIWPEAAGTIESTKELQSNVTVFGYQDTFEDTPREWVQPRRGRILVFRVWYRHKGVWRWATFVRGGYLDEPAESPFLDDQGNPEPGLTLQSVYVDRDGNRYGVVREYIGPQDDINKRRSKSVDLLNRRQVVADDGAVLDVEKARAQLHRADGWIEKQPNKELQVLDNQGLEQGQVQLLQVAMTEIDAQGPNQALTGKEGRNLSGRALQARQQGGIVEIGPLTDSMASLKKRVYRMVWNRIRQFWTAERWVRVTDDEKKLKFVGLNQPMTVREEMESEGFQIPPELEGDPRLDMPTTTGAKKNDVAQLEVDIILEEAPDTVTIQQEEFETLANLKQADPQSIPTKALIKASSLRNKDELIEMIEGDEEAQEQRAAMEQEVRQIAQADAMAEIAKKEAAAEKDEAAADKMAAETLEIVERPEAFAIQ